MNGRNSRIQSTKMLCWLCAVGNSITKKSWKSNQSFWDSDVFSWGIWRYLIFQHLDPWNSRNLLGPGTGWKPKRYGEKYATSHVFLWISHPFHRANFFTRLAHFSGADGALRSQDGYVARRLWQCWGGWSGPMTVSGKLLEAATKMTVGEETSLRQQNK